MRYLNAIAAHEIFVASGIYRRYIGDSISEYSESWTQHDVGGGAILTRIDQDARFTEGWSRLAEVLQNPEGGIERVKIQTNHSGVNAPFRMMKSDYSFLDGYVQIARTLNGKVSYDEIDLPEGTFVRLLSFLLFWGMALQRAQAGDIEQLPVFVPFHKPNLPPGRVTIGKLPTIENVLPETVMINGRERHTVRYVTLGKRVIWLDNQGVPLKFNHATGQFSDILHDYAHR